VKHLATALLAVIGLSVAGQVASAADLPMKAPPMVAAPVPFSWTGFYVGGHLGSGWGTKEYTNECAACDPIGTFEGQGTVNGFLGGFQAGYNYQIDWVVLGIEGDFSFADVNGNFTCYGTSACTAKADWFATLTGRIGGTVDHALLYVKGGVAWVHDKYNDYCSDCSTTEDPANFSGSGTRTGWTLGAGVEYAFTRNWSGKLEYDYMDFGTHTVTLITDVPSPFSPAPVDILQRVHVVKAGVNYRFDWGR
jgi:outer membrane immunogenic protein